MDCIYDTKQILEILPHRHPFLLVDRILECNGKDWIVGLKNVAANEPCFTGHFPGDPIFPGVLQLEAMAQTTGILMNKVYASPGKISYYVGVDNAKFRRLIRPGDTLRMEIKVERMRLGMARVHGVIKVEDKIACEADMMFGGGK
jgi:3-hydroxyacyl-[acyl-carrier-protein] dehydratase